MYDINYTMIQIMDDINYIMMQKNPLINANSINYGNYLKSGFKRHSALMKEDIPSFITLKNGGTAFCFPKSCSWMI